MLSFGKDLVSHSFDTDYEGPDGSEYHGGDAASVLSMGSSYSQYSIGSGESVVNRQEYEGESVMNGVVGGGGASRARAEISSASSSSSSSLFPKYAPTIWFMSFVLLAMGLVYYYVLRESWKEIPADEQVGMVMAYATQTLNDYENKEASGLPPDTHHTPWAY